MHYWLVLLVLFLGGCASTGGNDNKDAQVEDKTAATQNEEGQTKGYQDDGGVSSSELSEEKKYSIEALSDPNSPLSVRTVYFAFDSSDLTPESQDVLVEHAKFLSYNPGIQVVLEGHTDERGTRDYNLALGERRAKSVHEFLISQGVKMEQLEVVSFGEERPVALEHDENAWQLNRRVEIVYPAH